jgi:hypothetical protein
MVNKASLKNYSRGERWLLSGLFMVFACVLAWLASGLLQNSWQAHQLDQRFEREGVQTQGYVSGFRYVQYTGRYAHQSTGDYPVVAIDTPKGAFQIPTSYEHPLTKAQQDKLLWQKVDVLYLRDEPSVGRVVQWYGSSMWVLTGLGVFILLVALFVLTMAYRMLAIKNTPASIS